MVKTLIAYCGNCQTKKKDRNELEEGKKGGGGGGGGGGGPLTRLDDKTGMADFRFNFEEPPEHRDSLFERADEEEDGNVSSDIEIDGYERTPLTQRPQHNPFTDRSYEDEYEEDDGEVIHDAEPAEYDDAYGRSSSFGYSPPHSPSVKARHSYYATGGGGDNEDYNYQDYLKPSADRLSKPFKSRLNRGKVDKPWIRAKDKRMKWVTIIPLIGMLLGAGLAGYLGYRGWSSVETHKFCLVYQDTFDVFNTSFWDREVQIGGFGTGEFEWTTADSSNAYVANNTLFIVPTLTTETSNYTEAQLLNGATLNLTTAGICTTTDVYQCGRHSNATTRQMINPVRSARLTTKASMSIRYGKIEVVAKLPRGDWLWPAIWMMPVNDTYGPWPASGEIDIMESRGNGIAYPLGGFNDISSTLHWGPFPYLDRWWLTTNNHIIDHTDYTQGFHTFGLQWSQNRLMTYVDAQLQSNLYVPFSQYRWPLGFFPLHDNNGSTIVDPWSQTGRFSTPWDQNFYLILSLAIGGTNGYFPDNMASKPWVDASDTAMWDFWAAKDTWYPSWQNGANALQIKSVSMWYDTN